MRRTTEFRKLVESSDILMLPGAHDVLSGRIAEQIGFKAIICGGYSISATLLGAPDTSQLSQTEMADHYRRMCDQVSIPVFGDGDTGFGGIINVARTVRLYEGAGLAGMFLEDQVFPKRCGHMQGKDVISADEMAAKINAALDARVDSDFVIMARTDALAVHGLDAAIDRMSLCRELGADLLFVEAPRSVDDMQRICAELDGPCFANMIEGGLTPVLPSPELAGLGFAVAAFALGTTYVVAKAVQDYMNHLMDHKTSAGYENAMLDFDEFNEMIGLQQLREFEMKYGP